MPREVRRKASISAMGTQENVFFFGGGSGGVRGEALPTAYRPGIESAPQQRPEPQQ